MTLAGFERADEKHRKKGEEGRDCGRTL